MSRLSTPTKPSAAAASASCSMPGGFAIVLELGTSSPADQDLRAQNADLVQEREQANRNMCVASWRVRYSLLSEPSSTAFLLERARGRSNDRREEAGGRAFRCREKSSVGKTHCERLQLLCLVFYIFLCKVTCNRRRLATLPAGGGRGGRKTSDFLDFRNQWPMTRRRIRESWRNKPHLEKRPFRRVPADSRSPPRACCEALRGELEAGTERDERARFAASAHDRGGRRMSSSPSKRRTSRRRRR